MPTIGSVTKTVRIAPRDLEVINGLMADGTSWSGAIHKLCEGVPTKNSEKSGLTPSKEVEEIESMANFFGITLEAMLGKIYEGLNDGTLTYEGGKIVGTPDEGLERFKEACHDINKDPQEMLYKVTGMIEKGRI